MKNNKTAKLIRDTVRDWFGTLSVEEIMSNTSLSETFRKLELASRELEQTVTDGAIYEKYDS